MSLMIDNPDDLLRVLKKLGVKVAGVEELKGLLASINAHYNPDAARMRVAKLIGVAVPVTVIAIAGVVSFFLAAPTSTSRMTNHTLVALFAVLWGVAGLISIGALCVSLFFLLGSRRTAAALPPMPRGDTPALTAITGQLAGHAGQHDL